MYAASLHTIDKPEIWEERERERRGRGSVDALATFAETAVAFHISVSDSNHLRAHYINQE